LNGSRRRTGSRYEDLAAALLEREGCTILSRNFYGRSGELDIVARDGDTLVFCEVKYRSGDRCGTALEGVTPLKRRRICRTAVEYMAREGYGDGWPCRFDVIGISSGRVRHVKNAFEFTV
jgi:putative endonuclease